MPSVTIVKIKVRRGTDDQRKVITLEQGELGFTTDTKRLFIGDGVTPGGLAVAPQIYTPLSRTVSITGVTASIGEIVPAGSLIYQLTATDYSSLSSWSIISSKPDNVTIEYSGTDEKVLSLKENSINNTSFDTTAGYQFGGIIATPSNGLSANVDGSTVVIESNKITLSPISADKISVNAIGDGLLGGNGNKISINTGPGFGFDSSTKYLKLTSLPSKIATLDSIDTTTIYGDGLTLDNDEKLILDKNGILGYGLNLDPVDNIAVDGNSLAIPNSGISFLTEQGLYLNFAPVIGNNLSVNSTTGKLQADIPVTDDETLVTVNNEYALADIVEAGQAVFRGIVYSSKGQILSSVPTIYSTLTSSTLNSYLSVFNGCPNQVTSGYGYKNQTIIDVTSAYKVGGVVSSATIQLTSAGFITFESAETTEDVSDVGRFAIPIFNY